MNLSAYQAAAERTMLATQPVYEAMINAALGLCGEAAEIALAHADGSALHVLEECGDLLWYAAQMCHALGYSLGDFTPRDMGKDEIFSLALLWKSTGALADMTKKQVFHEKTINAVMRVAAITRTLDAVQSLLGLYGFTLEKACGENNAKLLKRFPAGFTTADANARKDEASL